MEELTMLPRQLGVWLSSRYWTSSGWKRRLHRWIFRAATPKEVSTYLYGTSACSCLWSPDNRTIRRPTCTYTPISAIGVVVEQRAVYRCSNTVGLSIYASEVDVETCEALQFGRWTRCATSLTVHRQNSVFLSWEGLLRARHDYSSFICFNDEFLDTSPSIESILWYLPTWP